MDVVLMRIAYIAISEDSSSHHAGVTHSRGITQGLAENGNEVFLFFRGKKYHQEQKNGVTEITLPRKGKWKPILGTDAQHWDEARTLIRTCDVIHERYSVNPLSNWLTKGRTVILEVNDPLTHTWKGWRKMAYGLAIAAKKKKVSGVITQTETLKRLIQPDFSVPVGVVSNGVDLSLFHTPTHTHNSSNVIFVGSFREWHGVEQLPQIVERVREKVPPARFTLVGDGPLREKVQSELRKKGLVEHVDFTGELSLEGVANQLSHASVAIAPFDVRGNPQLSRHGFWWCPVKLFEYLAAGLPIVSYDFDEVRTITGEAAVLVPPTQVDAFAGGIIRLLTQPALRTKMATTARTRSRLFTWKKMAQQTLAFYRQIEKGLLR